MFKIWNKYTSKKWIEIKEYNFNNNDEVNIKNPSNNIKKIIHNSFNPSIAVTGALDGSLIEGFGLGSKGGLIRLHWYDFDDNKLVSNDKIFNNIHLFSPCRNMVQGILLNDEYKDIFINHLNQEQYLGLSNKEKERRVLEYSDKYPNHMNIGGGNLHWKIEVLRLPNKMVDDLYIELGDKAKYIIDIIIKKTYPYWDVHDLVSLHTNAGSMSSTKQLMTFRRSSWRISNSLINNNFNGNVINIESNGDIYVIDDISYNCGKKQINVNKKLGIRVTNKNKSLKSIYYWIEKLLNKKESKVADDINKLEKIDKIKFIGTGVYKSLLQKLIRFQSKKCMLPDSYEIESDLVLIYCMFKILNSSPQYLPSLHRSVQGLENLSKRIGVIAFEDSNPEIIENIHHLFSIALLSQRVPTLYPSDNLIFKIFKIGLDLQRETNCIIYNVGLDNHISIADCDWNISNKDVYKKSAMLLRVIGSFKGDMQMVEYQMDKREKIRKSNDERPEYMLYPQHSFDQHVKPNIVLFFPDDLDYPKSKTIFGGRTKKMFDECTSINPRRTNKWKDFKKNSFVKMVQESQNNYYKLITTPSLIIEKNKKIKYNFKMSNEWIAGLLGLFPLGKIEVIRDKKKFSCEMMGSLNPFNINLIIVTPKSTVRGSYDNIKYAFDKDMQEKSLIKAKELLESGKLRLNKIKKDCLPIFIYNWYIRKLKKNNYYEISDNQKNWVKWNNFKSWNEHFTLNEDIGEISFDKINIYNNYKGIVKKNIIIKFLKKIKIEVLKRALIYIKHFKNSFKMNTISRDGGTGEGSDQVSIYDSGVFKLFLNLSILVPYALKPSVNQPFEFKVTKVLMLKYIRELIEESIKNKNNVNYSNLWYNNKKYEDKYNRKLFNFQEESVQRMLKDRNNNKTRHFMNIKVGLGKTLIVLTYLIRRKLNDIKYIIYTMPKSAFGSVIEEITSLGFNVNVYGNSKFIDKKWKESLENTGNNQVNVYSYKNNLKLKEGAINIIEHDGLRKYKETLLNIISDSIFIIDEVHKCLPKGTKRSSTALEVSKLALETIAFTGTPIINSQGAKLLINWLESNVDFNVNIDNFGVATNSMVSYSVKTDIEVINIDKVCKFKNKEQIKYDNFLKKNNLNGMISVCDKACTRKMIKLVVKKYKKKIKVFLVAKNKNHQVYLANKLINKISGSKIVCIGINSKLNDNCDFLPHINLTDKSVTNGNIDYDIVITRQNFSTGYNLTRMTCMITSVYFSSEPTREQLRGRINRLDQNNPKIEYITVIIGILKLVHNNYEKVKLISRCLQSKEISNKDLIQLKKLF
jgi:hypothetical protein